MKETLGDLAVNQPFVPAEDVKYYRSPRADTSATSFRNGLINHPLLRLDLQKTRNDSRESNSNRAGLKSVNHAQRQAGNLSLIEKDLCNFSTQKFNVENYTKQQTNLKMMAYMSNIDQIEIQKLRLQNQTLKKKVAKIQIRFEDTQSKLVETQRSLSTEDERFKERYLCSQDDKEDKAVQVPLHFMHQMLIREKEPENPKQIEQIMQDLHQLEDVFSQIETVHDQNKNLLKRYPQRYTSYVFSHNQPTPTVETIDQPLQKSTKATKAVQTLEMKGEDETRYKKLQEQYRTLFTRFQNLQE